MTIYRSFPRKLYLRTNAWAKPYPIPSASVRVNYTCEHLVGCASVPLVHFPLFKVKKRSTVAEKIASCLCLPDFDTKYDFREFSTFVTLKLFPMVAIRLLSPKWDATAPLKTDFPKNPPSQNPTPCIEFDPTDKVYGSKFGIWSQLWGKSMRLAPSLASKAFGTKINSGR